MLGHWEKALFIIGRACLEDVTDADNLNNYASFLIMTGGEQAAIPILEFLNAKYPNNSTILNNLGQAWFGLGDMEKAKKYLGDAIELCPNHSMANATLAKIFSGGSGPDKPKAISYLKASLKASYDPEKEADLAKLGYNTTYDDLPPFNYPMQQDPFNLVKLIQLIPRKLQTDLDDPEPAYAGQEFINGVEEFYKELNEEDVDLEKQVHDRASKLITDIPFQQKFLEAHNCPAHLLAARSVLLINAENIHSASPFLAQLWMPYTIVSGNGSERPLPPEVLIQQCMDFWEKEVSEPIRLLAAALHNDLVKAGDDCEVMNALYIAYLDRRAKFYNDGVDHIQNEFIQKSKRLQAWIFLNLYAIEDVPPKKTGNYTYTLVNRLPELVAKQRYQNKNYESMLHFMEWGKEYYDHHTSACKDKTSLNRLMGAQNIKQYKVKELRCEYQKVFRTPVDYVIELKCNTMTEITNSKLKKRNSNVDKASVESSKPKLKNIPGPLMQAIKKGPNNFPGEIEETQSTNQFAPLTAENKELSQFSFEYNKAGNLVGLNFQLNEDGTTLKDPDSIESGVDSRWCWNARASAKKGYMNKLLMK
jgi:tetratricopeptide (TPR) repeat protein